MAYGCCMTENSNSSIFTDIPSYSFQAFHARREGSFARKQV
jgi:hypothetical protein